MKIKTIDEVCKKPAGSFKQFIKKKQDFLIALENERKEQIRAACKAVQDLSWAA